MTGEEREQLVNNTSELVRKLQAQYNAKIQLQEQERSAAAAAEQVLMQDRLERLHSIQQRSDELQERERYGGPAVRPGSSQRNQELPWAWVDPMRSILLMEMADGTRWLRVQAKGQEGGKHHLVPFPLFDGWDEYLPKTYGAINCTLDGYKLTKLLEAIKFMRSLKLRREMVCSSFKEVLREIGDRSI